MNCIRLLTVFALATFIPAMHSATAGVVTVGGLNWTTSGTLTLQGDPGGVAGNGSVSGSGTAMTLVGADDFSGDQRDVTAFHTFTQAGALTFKYQGTSNDTGDLGGNVWSSEQLSYAKNGSVTVVSPVSSTASPFPATPGTGVINVVAGDVVTFKVHSNDGSFGEASLLITDLTFTPVPEPASLAVIAGAGLVGFAAWRRRSASVR